MKIVMVNDCAYVGETLLKHMSPNIEKQHIKRTRGLWSKTFGLAYKILRVKGDLYHVHYLLQDCYIVSRLGKKPLIGHAHGSDLRASLDHPLWSQIVKHNLKRCDKVLVSTPDVLGIARYYREDAEYLPNPVDTEIFYPKSIIQQGEKKKVLIASDSSWKVKGTDLAIKALSKVRDEVDVSIIGHGVNFKETVELASSLGLHLTVLPKVSHERINEYYWSADIVIDRFKLGSLGVVSLEAIACGRPVITYVTSKYPEYKDFPLKNVNDEDSVIRTLRCKPHALWKSEYEYLKMYHMPCVINTHLLEIYESLKRR